jgi:SAM-dependent methyltransferase
MAEIDFGKHASDYAHARPGFPPSFYERLEGFRPLDGCRALDLATGPGTIALELAARGARVLGIDISPALIEEAKKLAEARGLEDRISFRLGRAERTGEMNDSFDLVTAGQCWHWFQSEAATTECKRVLRVDGLLVIAYYSYLAPYSPPARDTEALILQLNPDWDRAGSDGIESHLIDAVIRGGFQFLEAFCFDHEQTFSHKAWRARMRTCNGVGSGGMPEDVVDRFDRDLADLLRQHYPDPMNVAHRVWCVVARKP